MFPCRHRATTLGASLSIEPQYIEGIGTRPQDFRYLKSNCRQYLQNFFRTAQARQFIITGHTDGRASDEYNMRLSKRRAEAVAKVAQSVGAPVLAVNWYGERMPRATNKTAAGMAENRRVEIICVK